MKKQKLKLEDLKVQSFVTSMEKTQKQTIDGGMSFSFWDVVTFALDTAFGAHKIASGGDCSEHACNPSVDVECYATQNALCNYALC